MKNKEIEHKLCKIGRITDQTELAEVTEVFERNHLNIQVRKLKQKNQNLNLNRKIEGVFNIRDLLK